jgi:probable rRNA maturation factor
MSCAIPSCNKLLKPMKKKTAKLKLTLQNRAKQPHTPKKIQFQQWAEIALIKAPVTTEVTIRIVNAPESAELNKKFRHKHGPTNVLSFIYSPAPGDNSAFLGDIVLCAELVQQEAATENKNLTAHWAHLTLHGILHLQGYDHIEPLDAEIMERLETEFMLKLGFTDPYQDNL